MSKKIYSQQDLYTIRDTMTQFKLENEVSCGSLESLGISPGCKNKNGFTKRQKKNKKKQLKKSPDKTATKADDEISNKFIKSKVEKMKGKDDHKVKTFEFVDPLKISEVNRKFYDWNNKKFISPEKEKIEQPKSTLNANAKEFIPSWFGSDKDYQEFLVGNEGLVCSEENC